MPDDPYANPYVADTVGPDNVIPSSPGAADAAAERAGAFAQQHREAMSGREKEIRDIQEKQQLNVNSMTQMLDDTVAQIKRARSGQSNFGLLEMGGSMLASPGNFGQQLGAGFKGLAHGIQTQRDEDTGSDLKIADLQLKRATIANAPLEQRLAYMKALQTGDIAAMGRIEAMQIKAQAGGTDPADVKKWRIWQQEPKNAGKPLEEFMKFQSGLTSRAAALTQEFELAKKDNPDIQWEEFLRRKSAASAQGHAQGEDTGKSKANFGTYQAGVEHLNDTINKMITHPGMENSVGKMWANAPAIPGSPKADFLALEEGLKGQVFLEAYNALRGAGAITEAEGLKATVSRLPTSRAQSKEAYLENIQDYQKRLNLGLEIMRARSGMPATEKAAPAPTNPSPTPPGQTGQTPPNTANEGQKVWDSKGKPYIIRNGKPVPDG